MKILRVQAAQILVHIEDKDVGDVVQNAPLFKMSKTPGAIRFLGAAHASSSDEVFERELGKSKEELEKLRANGVIA